MIDCSFSRFGSIVRTTITDRQTRMNALLPRLSSAWVLTIWQVHHYRHRRHQGNNIHVPTSVHGSPEHYDRRMKHRCNQWLKNNNRWQRITCVQRRFIRICRLTSYNNVRFLFLMYVLLGMLLADAGHLSSLIIKDSLAACERLRRQ